MAECLNVVGLARNGHRFLFLCDDRSDATLDRTLQEFVDDPELDFSEADKLLIELQLPLPVQSGEPEAPEETNWL